MFTRPRTYLRIQIIVLALALAGALAHQGASMRADARAETTTVIVELKGEPAAVRAARAQQSGRTVSPEELQSYRAELGAAQEQFLSALPGRGVNAAVLTRAIKDTAGNVAANVDLRYTLVYNGLAMTVPSGSLDALRAMPEVKSVKPNQMLYTQLNNSVKYIGAPKVYGAAAELTQFDNLREGFEGQGINIAVIDTGIDWTHPMFGGDPTPPRLGVGPAVGGVNTNQKVIYYLPLTDIAANDGFGHGTHVASTAAGYLAQHPGADGAPLTGDEFNLHGVAPQAKLMSYTVCSNIRSIPGSLGLPSIGGCESADTIMALEDAVSPFTLVPTRQASSSTPPATPFVKPVAHVINLSLGGAGGPDSPTAIACSNAALTGATVVASSGNSGPGEGTTGAPAAGTHVISVGATTHPGVEGSQWSADLLAANSIPQGTTGAVSPAKNFAAAPGFERFRLNAMLGTTPVPANSMAQRYAYVNDPLVQWPASVSGRIALVRSALGATIFDIVAQAANAGAVGVILNDDRGTVNGVKTTIPAATIMPADFEVLVDALSSTDNNAVDPANGAVSEMPVRMNPTFSDAFMGEMGDFSSRGPVRGLGQIKPDVSAPGVAVLAAVPPASLLGALGAALESTPNYLHLDGTSMSAPHVAGAAALVKQAHPDWSPDMIRTAMINTSTNMRNRSGGAKADGPSTADSIIAQGGGLIEVSEALNAKALMGVAGDGINTPGILGSHSYGEVPVIDSRVTHTESVTVTLRDLSGQGGTYNLGVANNRDLQLAGITVEVSQPSVTVPAGGAATFNVHATVDGDALRDTMATKTNGTSVVFEAIQMQWFVTARRGDNAESLRMPFFFRPGKSQPAVANTVTLVQNGTVLVGDAGAQRDNLGYQPELSEVSYVELPFEVDAATSRVEATTEWLTVPGGLPDLDYELVGPDGNVIISVGVQGGPEHVSVTVSRAGTYKHRVNGWANGPTEFTVTTVLTKGGGPPALNTIAGEFVDAQGRQVDYDGNFEVSWQAQTGDQGYELERSSDGGANWSAVASLPAWLHSYALTNQPNGTYQFRVRALTPGRVGYYVTAFSSPQAVTVDRRSLVDITAATQGAMVPMTYNYNGSTTQLEWTLTNKSGVTYYPRVEMKIVRINAPAGGVTVANADNGGSGLSTANAALFDYTSRLGADEAFAPGEKSASRVIRFNDSMGQLFSFDAVVTAFERQGGASAATSGGGSEGASATGSGSTSGGDTVNGLPITHYVRVTVNPLTRSVTTQLLSGVL